MGEMFPSCKFIFCEP